MSFMEGCKKITCCFSLWQYLKFSEKGIWLALKNGPSSVEADVPSASLLQQEIGLWFLQATNGDS